MSTVLNTPRAVRTRPAHPEYTSEDALAGHWTQASSTELRRRLWHMAPGLLPFVLWPVPHQDPLSATLLGLVAVAGLGLAAGVYFGYHLIRRSELDREQRTAVLGYLLSVLAMIFLFPSAPEMGMAVLAVLAFGDGSATLGGIWLAGPKLPWNRRKTWSGLASFVLVGTAMAATVYWGESNNPENLTKGVHPLMAILCTLPAVILSAIAESIPSRVNDNIRVGVVSSVMVLCMHTLLIGWPG